MDAMEYAGAYQARRRARCKAYDAIFLPLEVLRHIETDRLYLSVSFSVTGAADTYFTQSAELIRAVQVRLKWFVFPTTVSRVLKKEDFLSSVGDLLETNDIDGEEFWVLRKDSHEVVRARIASFDLGNAFRTEYRHAYLPDADPRSEVP